jgi:hypothetical protein
VTELNPGGSVAGTFAVGLNPVGIAFDGTHMWVVNDSTPPNGTVTELKPDGSVTGAFTVGIQPVGIAFDGTHLWIPCRGDPPSIGPGVTELNLDGSVAGTTPITGIPTGAVAFDGTTNIWVGTATGAASGTVSTIGPGGPLVGMSSVDGAPGGIAFGGGHVWVTNANASEVTMLGFDGSVEGTVPVGTSPIGIASDGADHIWVANSGSNNVTELNAS